MEKEGGTLDEFKHKTAIVLFWILFFQAVAFVFVALPDDKIMEIVSPSPSVIIKAIMVILGALVGLLIARKRKGLPPRLSEKELEALGQQEAEETVRALNSLADRKNDGALTDNLMVPKDKFNQEVQFVLNKIKNNYKDGENVEYWICSPPLSSQKTLVPADEMELINKLVEWGAVAIQEPNGREAKISILDIGYAPPERISTTVLYLEILQPKFDEIYAKHEL